MAASAEDTLRQLLAQFQVAALEDKTEEQRYGKEVRAATFYYTQLRRAALSTPLDVIQKEKQLYPLLDAFTPPERECLIDAAYSLTGLKDRDRFHSSEEIRKFAQDENFGDVADAVHLLWELGIRSCAAMDRVAEQDKSALERLVGSHVPKGMQGHLLRFASTYTAMKDLATVLACSLPRPNMETASRSSTQADVQRDKHPESLKLWDDFEGLVLRHKDTKKKTERRFKSNRPVDPGPAKEYCVSRVFDSEVGSVMNAAIKYWKRKRYLEQEEKKHALWEPQGSRIVQTDGEVGETARAAGHHGSDDTIREALAQENAARARGAASSRIKRSRFFFDQYLRMVDPDPDTDTRDGRSVVELKQVERLHPDPGLQYPQWTEVEDAPDFVELWNRPKTPNTPRLQKNVIGAIEQWNEYASGQGIRYGLIFTHMWTWAIRADGSNNLEISQAYRFDAEKPTVLEIVDFITHQALSKDGIGTRWEPLKDHPPSVRVVDSSGGPANRTRSIAFAEQPPPGNGAEGPSDSDMDASALGSPQSVLPGSTNTQRKEAMRLAQAAAAFEMDWLLGVLGRGALGEVFWGRMPDGRAVALKIAASGDLEEQMLRNEASAYLAVQDLWNKGVPELLLAGDLHALGGGYGLGTSVLSGRPLKPGDAELLPAALAIFEQIHSSGVIHGDLRPENFVVMEPDIAEDPADKTIFVLDFSHAKFDRSQEAQRSEISSLLNLFQSL